jgi:hypothetical protein
LTSALAGSAWTYCSAIAFPFPQRRQLQRHDRQAVQQVFAEFTGRNGLAQILVGRRDDANVHHGVLGRSHPAKDPTTRTGTGWRLQGAQQFRLHRQTAFADFVQEQGAAAGLFDGPFAILFRPSKCTLDVSEQLGFEKIFRDRGTVDGHKPLVAAMAGRMDRFGKHLFSGAAFAEDQHGYIVDRRPLRPANSQPNGAALAQDALEPSNFLRTSSGKMLPEPIGIAEDLGQQIGRDVERDLGRPDFVPVGLEQRGRILAFAEQDPDRSHGWRTRAQMKTQLVVPLQIERLQHGLDGS